MKTLLCSAVGALCLICAGAIGSRSAEPQPKRADRGKLLVWKETKFVFVAPDGKEVGELPAHPDKLIMNEPALSPDGKRVAFTVNEDPPADDDGNLSRHVFVRDADGKDAGFKIALTALNVAWTPDGKGLLATELRLAKELKDAGFANILVDVATKKETRLDLPKAAQVYGMTPDGKSFVAVLNDFEARKIHLALISRDGMNIAKLTEIRTEGPDLKLSPDGTRLLFKDFDPDDKEVKDVPKLQRLFVLDVQTKKRQRLAGTPLNGLILGYCWSPDGKQMAYTWKRVEPGVPLAENTDNQNDPKLKTETESHLIVADADGKNQKTLLSVKAQSGPQITIGSVDWR
jgi:Tol biopolymer transport system component